MKQPLVCKRCDEERPLDNTDTCLRCRKLRLMKPTLKKKDKQFNGSLAPATYKHDGL